MENRDIPGNPIPEAGRTTSFVVRLWLEPSSQGTEWRGHVTHVQDQTETYFRDFRVLLDFLNSHAGARAPLLVEGGRPDQGSGGGKLP